MRTRWRIAAFLSTFIGLTIGGQEYARLHNAVITAGRVEVARQKERRNAGLPVDDWARPYLNGGNG